MFTLFPIRSLGRNYPSELNFLGETPGKMSCQSRQTKPLSIPGRKSLRTFDDGGRGIL